MRWTDSDGRLENAFTLDEALTWVSAYWFSGAIGTSFAAYAADDPKDWPRIQAPTVFTVFPHDLVNAPRCFADRFFAVADWRPLRARRPLRGVGAPRRLCLGRPPRPAARARLTGGGSTHAPRSPAA
ncbi:hypothetical protein [Herbiconiux sp. VKM Ac-1786]|uniref:hypothetical protein n=1 Tax=Herbiconiux sp. VKM Ac-1786 TaxID=2783824 RepID=UPI001E399CBE|nr:hypothetical protein [Herbiconiux sp. VKM Ac-1786]